MTSRISRGFHRIGIVLAVPVLMVAGVSAGYEAWRQWNSESRLPNADDAFWKRWGVDPDAIHQAQVADYNGTLTYVVLAVALYAVARAIGWAVDGFMGPARKRQP